MLGSPSGDEPNSGWKFFLATLIMTVAAGVFTIARLATRMKIKCMGSDDYAIAAASVFSIVTASAIFASIKHGYGKHIRSLTTEQASKALQWFFIAQTPYKVTVCLNKTSAVLLYKRIFIQQVYQRACWTILAIVVLWSVGTIVATVLQCVPVRASWNNEPGARCIDKDAFWISYAVGNILTDVIVLALPVRPVVHLQMPLRQRLLLCGVFLLGGFVTVTSILRTTAVSNSLRNQQDITYNFINRGIWTVVEANTGIICASLPALKAPIAWLLPRFFRDTTRKDQLYGRKTFRYGRGSGNNSGRPWHRTLVGGISGGEDFNTIRMARTTGQLSMHSDEQSILEPTDIARIEPNDAQNGGITKQTIVSVQSHTVY